MTYLLEKSAAQVQQMHHKTTQLPDCFMLTWKSSPHDIVKVDLASRYFCREYWAQRETKLSELGNFYSFNFSNM